ncbi:MAG: hypothetical protein PWQ11_491 [Candidatus Diapherotrites archaeon]|nr:hypothetical protein [Candidatus Diapherotrites archaeon]
MFRVVLVEPHYAGNIGSVARLIMNFEAHELYLVNPLVSPLDEEAMIWAVNAKPVLERAKIVSTIEAAIKDCAVVAATTAKPGPKMVRRTPITPKEFAEQVKGYWKSKERVAILFGREPSGLANEELELADITVTIPTSKNYPAMNLSHSVAVILYELYMQKVGGLRLNAEPPSADSFQLADSLFNELIQKIGRRNPRETLNAWQAILRRGARTDKEVRAVIGVLSEVKKRCFNDKRN